MKILIKFPSRNRPEKFRKCLENIYRMAARPDKLAIIATIDDNDPLNELYHKSIFIDGFPCTIIGGISNNKIHAVNRDIPSTAWDIILIMSDDMMFIRPAFDDFIRQDMQQYFPDTDGVLHYNDGNQKDNVMTMGIMGRKYYDRFGYIYYPDYKSVWCDVEQTEVAYMLGKYRYMGDDNILFRHMHPAFGLTEYDEQYCRSENLNVWGEDLKTCIERKQRAYDLTGIVNAYKYPPPAMEQWAKDLNNVRINNGLVPYEFNVKNHGYIKNK